MWPLSFDSDFVEVGPPANVLKNDLLFIAKKMRLVYPLLPPCTEKEFGMIKSFLKTYPQPKERDMRRLCKIFKVVADGAKIFYKILSLIKPAIKRWVT